MSKFLLSCHLPDQVCMYIDWRVVQWMRQTQKACTNLIRIVDRTSPYTY